MPRRFPWMQWWVVAEVIGVVVFATWLIRRSPREPEPATMAPVTRDASISTAQDVPTGTAAEADTLLVDVRTLDSSIVVDLRYRDANNFTGAPLPGYEANRALLRREAAASLARVQRALEGEGLDC